MAADQSPNYVSAVHATKLPPAEAERVFNKLCNELVRTHVTESSSPKSGLNHIPLETHISTARDKLTPTFGADDTNGNERQEIEHREMPEDGHVSRGLLDANSPELLNGTLYDFTSSKSPIQPLSFMQFDILLGLSEAATRIAHARQAAVLLNRLCPYVVQCPQQPLLPSSDFFQLNPPPWQLLTVNLIDAILNVGQRFPGMRHEVNQGLSSYLQQCTKLSQNLSRTHDLEGGELSWTQKGKHLQNAFALVTSLNGFLEATALHASFWTQEEQLNLLSNVQSLVTDEFLTAVETIVSMIRNAETHETAIRNLRRFIGLYDRARLPIGAISIKFAFAKLIERCAGLLVVPNALLVEKGTLPALMSSNYDRDLQPVNASLWDAIAESSARQLADLEEGSDYLQLGTAWQLRCAYALKASCLTSYLCCAVTQEEAVDLELLLSWLEKAVADPLQSSDEVLACTALRCLARLAKESETVASTLSRSLPQMLIHRTLVDKVGKTAAECLLYVLRLLSPDAVITTIWGLGNSLTVTRGETEKADELASTGVSSDHEPYRKGTIASGSTASLLGEGHTTSSHNRDLVINAIVVIAKGVGDTKIVALAISMLVQKFGKVTRAMDYAIMRGAGDLACKSDVAQFKSLVRFYLRLIQEGVSDSKSDILEPVGEALAFVASSLTPGSALYQTFVEYILQTIISKGDIRQHYSEKAESLQDVTAEMAVLLHPLCLLVANTVQSEHAREVQKYATLQRDAWYNLVLHGYSLRSAIGRRHLEDLKILARYSEPLVPVDRESRLESPIELNMVLKRGSSNQSTSQHRSELLEYLPNCKAEIKDLDHSETVFLKAAHLVETLRSLSGDCTRVPAYFVEPRLQGTTLGVCVRAVALSAVDNAVRLVLNTNEQAMTTRVLAEQLSTLLQSCCHRVMNVQEIAYLCVDRMLERVPSTLCQKSSLFTLLDLLTAMWSSCLQAEIHEYEWASDFQTPSGVTITLSDDFAFRNLTLRTLHKRAKEWTMKALNIAPLDIKGLLQTYLSNYAEEEGIGHMSLGRSFALEMGAAIPQTDYRLSAIDMGPIPINTASDFIAQYTSRQEYRFTDPAKLEKLDNQNALQFHDHLAKIEDSNAVSSASEHAVIDAVRQQSNFNVRTALETLSRCIEEGQAVDMVSLREALRLAASLLCRLEAEEDRAVIPFFVKIPFDIFSKSSIRLGLSLWMGVIKENEMLEADIIREIVVNWKRSVELEEGLFDRHYLSDILPDPFFVRMEYAPSDYDFIRKQQQRVHDKLTPHFLILLLISSHYMAERLNGNFIESQAMSMMETSLPVLADTASHPLARELHFNIILFSLKILRYGSHLSPESQRSFKDKILSAALAWFRNEPRYSFGGNRIQIKAETHLLADVSNALNAVKNFSPENTPEADLRRKRQDLLQHLLDNEQTRLVVWLFPLDHQKRHFFASGQSRQTASQTTVLGLVETAWREDASLAINLTVRYPSDAMNNAVRRMILIEPQLACHDPRAVRIMLGASLPNDVAPQLEHLVSWAPVDPITAVAYLLPAYGNQPQIIQYAMRSLESHDVENVTFFYVPQIVQSLRYDALGHIEKFIVRTAGVSQLFAHQIIWNIKANSYKDEDATDPDPMKPKLDKVMDHLVSSFGGKDKDFYEREFAFFNEVTGVSGKLRPFLKASKPEKKQKIEEELRKIKIDPGVYLPSNPDGVVVGIDRSSGKPLQSHAKTPYIATFLIRKERQSDPEEAVGDAEKAESPTSPILVKRQAHHIGGHSRTKTASTVSAKQSTTTYEIWQSAIFKVGDDCRQDILALQMIACFRGIFAHVGLPVYVFPYRVTATAPGCGVIDVLPRTISRDMLGREAVNGLYPWFVSKFGSESSPAFQKARAEFVKSLAAYSIISYLLQFKDRHNGNIMFDEDGHILHIDFGFCFDIAPGGVKFERAPFKLTKEMLSVMGGSTETQAFRWFEELCVKAFLAARMYVEPLSNVVLCMLDSGLPCFKPVTIKHFKERFVLDKDERQAAEFVRMLIRKSLGSKSTRGYDEFQLLTNGIPF